MPLSKIADARKLSNEDLAAEILAGKRKLFELRLQQATRRLEKPHEFRHTRHRLAQLMTVERERQLGIEPSARKPAKKESQAASKKDTKKQKSSVTQEEE